MKRTALSILALVAGLAACQVDSPTTTASDTTVSTYIATKYSTDTQAVIAANADTSVWKGLNCHDPFLFRDDDGTWYSFSTDASIGNEHTPGIQIRKSSNLIDWTCLATPAIPNGYWGEDFLEWEGFTKGTKTANGWTSTTASVWAPCVIKFNGKYYMYYGMNANITTGAAAGKAHAYIGVATSDSVTGPYKHLAKIVRSTTLGSDPTTTTNDTTLCTNTSYGAIDPNITWDANGDMWMNYGSWRSGISIMRLNNTTGLPLVGDTDTNKSYGTKLAGGGGASTEGACVLRHGDWYYLFYSQGDLSADYSVRVGRRAVTSGIAGAYVDSSGYDLTGVTYTSGSANNNHAHGNKILGGFQFGSEYGWRAPGGQSICEYNGQTFLACHSRTSFLAGYFFYLQIRQMYFTDDGWPILNPNEYYGETLEPLATSDVTGFYDAVMTVRGSTLGAWTDFGGTSFTAVNAEDANETASKILSLKADGTIGGSNYSGTWAISDSYKVTIHLATSGGTSIGTFTGVISSAWDWARKGTPSTRATKTFTTFCAATGEYFFGNLKNF